ncbi:uncharacterized protein LOC112052396 isoform X1 [Bicyclus anynana]|uniref:Uncharacterized protein LOC112052396 isoform X1 n=1 Tax=Bicyclus anynana TaxID=110368 RepID=A0A6J1NQR2_BICAN|nr:uncharacterized protein LOC112052396 isoform X1 [Bicyclus anynana]
MDWKRCFKFQHEVVDNLRVSFSSKKCMLSFWNKYQIFLLNEQELDSRNWPLIFLNTDFEICQLIIAEYLLCLDYEGTLFGYSLNLHQTATAHKRAKPDFRVLERNILRTKWYENEDLLFSLQLDSNELCIKTYKMKSSDDVNVKLKPQSHKKILNRNLFHSLNEIKREKCILSCFRVNESDYDGIKHIFKGRKNLLDQPFIIIMSFDKLTLYTVLVDLKFSGETLKPVKLLTSPSEINEVVFIKENAINIIVSLTSGTLIKHSLNKNFNTPNITHLNTGIHKLTVLNEKLIYTDGSTMWVATNTFSEPDTKLRQLFIRNAKDFTHIGNAGQIICTTYSNLVYTFNVNDEPCYLPVTDSDYYPAEHLFNNMGCLDRILKEVEKNDDVIKNIKKEENYITTLALSNRQDIMNEIIQSSIYVYENYEDILKDGLILNLTNKLKEYFDKNSFYFLIKMSAVLQQNHVDILANIFLDCKIHITILSEQQVLKTICMPVLDQLKNLNIVVPLKMTKSNITSLFFDIRIIKKIPKVLSCKENLWTALYYKQIALTPELFIKTDHCSNKIQLLKEPEDSIENLLYKASYKHHGHLFRIAKVSEDFFKWSFYIKLPNRYKEFLQNEMFYKEHFNTTKAKFLLKEISSEEFLNSRKNISFTIANERVDMEIINHGVSDSLSNNMIKVSSVNPRLALGIRNFFSNLAHNNFQTYQPGQEYINCFRFNILLKKTENTVNKCLTERLPFEEFSKIFEQFQMNLSQILV